MIDENHYFYAKIGSGLAMVVTERNLCELESLLRGEQQ